MSNPEMHDGKCELCGKQNIPENLYIDLLNNQWTLICPKCFYSKNQDREKEYYDRVKEINPDIMTESEFNKTSKRVIPIGNTYPYFKANHKFMPVQEKTMVVDLTLKHFFGLEKINRKFFIKNAKAKCSEQVQDEGVVLLVAIVGKVRFNSYLEYLEHKMFEEFRKECQTVLR